MKESRFAYIKLPIPATYQMFQFIGKAKDLKKSIKQAAGQKVITK